MSIDGNENVRLSVESWNQGKEVTKRGWLMLAEMQLDGRNDFSLFCLVRLNVVNSKT